jgi:predicted DCC family thiol-disulfide oxidoreductase YuxK
MSPDDDARHPIVLYDGVCNLCAGVVKFIIRRDPERLFRFCSLQSPVAAPFLRRHGISEGEALQSFVLIDYDDEGKEVALRRSSAALGIARRLPSPWSLLVVFECVPSCLRDGVYNAVARNRYTVFGKSEEGEDCLMPSKDVRARFLDWGAGGKLAKGAAAMPEPTSGAGKED